MLIPIQDIYRPFSGSSTISAAVAAIIKDKAIDGELQTLDISTDDPVASDVIFNLSINGVAQFAGGSRPKITAGNTSCSKTRLTIAVDKEDVITVDVENAGSGINAPIYCRYGIEDGVAPPTAYEDLTDVDMSGISDGDVSVWDAGTSTWLPGAGGGGGGSVWDVENFITSNYAVPASQTTIPGFTFTGAVNEYWQFEVDLFCHVDPTPGLSVGIGFPDRLTNGGIIHTRIFGDNTTSEEFMERNPFAHDGGVIHPLTVSGFARVHIEVRGLVRVAASLGAGGVFTYGTAQSNPTNTGTELWAGSFRAKKLF